MNTVVNLSSWEAPKTMISGKQQSISLSSQSIAPHKVIHLLYVIAMSLRTIFKWSRVCVFILLLLWKNLKVIWHTVEILAFILICQCYQCCYQDSLLVWIKSILLIDWKCSFYVSTFYLDRLKLSYIKMNYMKNNRKKSSNILHWYYLFSSYSPILYLLKKNRIVRLFYLKL